MPVELISSERTRMEYDVKARRVKVTVKGDYGMKDTFVIVTARELLVAASALFNLAGGALADNHAPQVAEISMVTNDLNSLG